MEKKVFLIVLVYFIIGAVAIFLINKKYSGKENKQRWIKYFNYLLIVTGIIISINCVLFRFIAFLIYFIAIYEVIKVWMIATAKSKTLLFTSMTILLMLLSGFYLFTLLDYRFQLLVYCMVFTFDGFSQITGQLIGKTKFTLISPNKTIEGVAGGLFTAVITVMILEKDLPLPFGIIIHILIICIAALAGDLLASYYKRLCGVKDYSNLIPGHGGILDRFDSFIAAGAVYWLVWFLKNHL